MAISAKIQLGTGGVAGYNEWEVVYNASTQPTYKTYVGLEVGQPEPQIIWHTPDNVSPVPVSATNQNKIFRLTMDVAGANWDAIINSLAPLKRALNGADSQALRSFIRGDANKVRIALKPDGATYTTYYNVIAGTVDDSMAYYTAEAISNTLARQVVFMLTTEPTGYGDSFVLSNSLVSSPHMLVDSNSDGLADGWANYGTPTATSLSNLHLIGGYSQSVTADSGSGIASTVVTASTSTSLVAYVWVYSLTMSGFQMSLRDGSNNVIETITCTAANADKTAVDSGGRTWYRFTANGQNTAAANARVSVTSTSTGKTFYVDGAYLTTGTQTAPPAFSSAKTLANNGVNGMDFWGIPGDMPALMRYELTGISDVALVMGKKSDGTQLAAIVRYLIQDTYFANGSTWATTSNYTRASADASVSDPYTATSGGDDNQKTARAIAETIWKVYAVARASATDNGLYAQWSADLATYVNMETVLATTANTWELWDLGILNPKGVVMPTDPIDPLAKSLVVTPFTYSTFGIRLVSVIPSSGTVDIDYLLMIPVGEEHIVLNNTPSVIAGDMKSVFTLAASTTPAFFTDWRGAMWKVDAGQTMTRIVYHDFNLGGVANKTNPGDDLTITATVIPRTSHLLGTK